ncbi:hypothetical protein BCF74_10615 [Knoellia remsis]|uniref:Uncharacterized protein n=1 Tax=Knoellia remsis TaxID=407159 RepID=A0A2T0UTV0_9MICO|nr:hypothetical protein [Knoellia remsis]PRY61267.1 hypothetical protein BCF74_10615 [Knoellia remsis]
MVKPVHPARLTEVSRVLDDLRDRLAAAEDDLLSSLVVLGEPEAQRTVDGWFDQVVDLLRAVDEITDQHVVTLSRAAARRSSDSGADAPAPAVEDALDHHDVVAGRLAQGEPTPRQPW